MKPTKCARKHCEHLAEFTPRIMIPALGCPLAEHDPLSVKVGVPLCEYHSKKVEVGEFLIPRMKRLVIRTCKAYGKAKPDFGRAFIEREKIQ